MEDKISAIYALRDAAEKHARLEAEIGDEATVAERHALLDARLHLEEKTQAAVEACVYCGRSHADGDDCTPGGKLIQGNFGRHDTPPDDAEAGDANEAES
jgi:hypothetical protein